MKIAFLMESFPALSETFVLNQITGLLERNHDVRIYARRGEWHKLHPDVPRYGLMDRTQYIPAVPRGGFGRALQAAALLKRCSRAQRRRLLQTLNVFRFGHNAADLSLLYHAVPFLEDGRFDIIHCHFGPMGVLATQLRACGILAGSQTTAFHGYDMSSYLRRRGTHVYNVLFEAANVFMPISDCWKNRLIELGAPPDQVVVHRMGIDISRFAFRERHRSQNEPIVLASVARLVEKKGIEYAIRAVGKLRRTGRLVRYDILGEGPLRERLARLAAEIGVDDQVRLLGWKDSQEVASILDKAHVLLAPSVTARNGDQEGVPVAIMEAMARGLPVLSTWHSGIPELVQDGISGLLVPERDPAAIAERIEYLLDHPDVYRALGRAGRSFVERHYDINQLNDRLVGLYHSMLIERSIARRAA